MTTEWCTCEENLNSLAKALETELTLEPQTTKGGLELYPELNQAGNLVKQKQYPSYDLNHSQSLLK